MKMKYVFISAAVLFSLCIFMTCESSSKRREVAIDSPIGKPTNPADLSNFENASRATKISTSFLRMFVSTYNTAMNEMFPALVFFGEVFKQVKTSMGTEIQMPPEGTSDGNCQMSGTFHAEIKNADSKTKHIAITFNECRGDYAQGGKVESIATGSIAFDMENTTWTGASPDVKGWFPNKISGSFKDVMFKLTQEDAGIQININNNISAEGNFMPQGATATIPTAGDTSMAQGISMNATMAGVMALKGYMMLNNQKVGVDYAVFLDSLNFKVSGFMEGMTVNGGWRMRDNVEQSNSFEAVFENVNMAVASAGDSWSESVGAGSTIYSKCIGGKVGVQTLEKVSLTFPGCPTTGVVMIDGAGTAKASFTSAGGLTVDAGADGSVEKTYPVCEDPQFTACGNGL